MSKALASIQAELAKELEALSGKIAAPSGFTISTKGKVFTLPDGLQHKGPLEAVILDWRTAHTYYQGQYNPAKIEPPACFALGKIIDTMAPSDKSEKKQALDCKTCPQNQWGSAATGKGKACKNSRKLAIVPVDATEDTTPWILMVSPTGIKGFDAYVTKLGNSQKLMPIQVVTQISFNEAEAFPTLLFGHPVQFNQERIQLFVDLRASAQSMLDKEPDPQGFKAG